MDAAAAGCCHVHHLGDTHSRGASPLTPASRCCFTVSRLRRGWVLRADSCQKQLSVQVYLGCIRPYCTAVVCAQGFNLPAEGSWFWVEGMIDLFFYVDLVLNFFVAYEVRCPSAAWATDAGNPRLAG